ncbi:MAG: transglycosylase SLT domain-containing protein [Arenicellales bacterium]
MKRVILWLAVLCLLEIPAASYATQPAVDPNLVSALRQAVEDPASFDNGLDALVWLADMSERLRSAVSDPFYRVSLLKSIHAEATRIGISPALVLAVIQVESGFDRFAVSDSGARGLMQVMPFWKKEIGHPKDDLFFPPTNLRYGCTILHYYLKRTHNELATALEEYNGSFDGSTDYATRVLSAYRVQWRDEEASGKSNRP